MLLLCSYEILISPLHISLRGNKFRLKKKLSSGHVKSLPLFVSVTYELK